MTDTGKYEPLVWQIVKDRLGYASIHETNEDGDPGDIVCDVYGDHSLLLAAAPDLLEALAWFINDIDGTHTVMVDFDANVDRARAALAKAGAA